MNQVCYDPSKMLQAAGKACVGGTARSLADPNSKVLARKGCPMSTVQIDGFDVF